MGSTTRDATERIGVETYEIGSGLFELDHTQQAINFKPRESSISLTCDNFGYMNLMDEIILGQISALTPDEMEMLA